jgi:hypothetical protein
VLQLTISFTSGIDSTYDEYIFKFINIHPATNGATFTFNGSTDGGSSYNVTKTTTHFIAIHSEADDEASVSYYTGQDLAQSTAYQNLGFEIGNVSDESFSGTLQLFEPSSNTFVKHFTAKNNYYNDADRSFNSFVAGYGNTTSAINAIDFKI